MITDEEENTSLPKGKDDEEQELCTWQQLLDYSMHNYIMSNDIQRILSNSFSIK